MFTSDKFVQDQVVDMSDVIQTVTPVITPFSSLLMSKNVPAEGAKFSWIQEELGDSAVTQTEGGDAPNYVEDQRDILDNYAEIFAATATVSNTAQASNAKGINDLMAREVSNKTKAIKMRIENKLINGQKGYDAGTKTYTTDGILNLINSNHRETGATFDKDALEQVLSGLYDNGVNYDMVCFLPANMKKMVNGFENFEFYARDKFAGVDVEQFHSVYGTISFVLSEKLENKLFVVNHNYLELATLIPFGGKLEPVSGSKQSIYLETQVGLKLLNDRAGASFTITE